jgi:hypothetical protein
MLLCGLSLSVVEAGLHKLCRLSGFATMFYVFGSMDYRDFFQFLVCRLKHKDYILVLKYDRAFT